MSDSSLVQTLAQSLLAQLGPSQNNRLVRLHTPLGEDVLLAERMVGMEGIGPGAVGAHAGFKIELLLLSTNAHLYLKDLMGQPVRVDLLTQQGRAAPRYFHGHVTHFSRLGSDAGLARYKAVVEPWFVFMDRRQDGWVFQNKTVIEIVEEVFADYRGQGQLAPAWRWDLADRSVYPQRSLCVQYFESDLAFVHRLLAEEGLFYWFEHCADDGPTLGSHTLVIADHNGSFKPNVQSVVRFTQSGSASFREDSLTEFDEHSNVVSTSLSVASWDYRNVQPSSADIPGDPRLHADDLELPLRDQPGAYAYENSAQAKRIAWRQLEAIQARGQQFHARGSFRQAAPGTVIHLSEHPTVASETRFVTLAAQHRARSNISADLHTSLTALLGNIPREFDRQPAGRTRASTLPPFKGGAHDTDEPIYQAHLLLQDADIAVRAPAPALSPHGDLLFKRPRIEGTLTAIVVGLGEPVHTDRDLRIKVQFHWQRGGNSSHRLDHPSGDDNAPASDASGTWVRVSHGWAGSNWGTNHPPRLGQEVLVGFIEGDPDRPLVVGSVYGGRGQVDAPGNQVGGGAATATGNAPAWFPGSTAEGALQGHQHAQVLAGIKTQSLDTSQSGVGGYNQLVFDDTTGQSRTMLSSTRGPGQSAWLQLGHLLRQDDNRRLDARGHGFELATTDQGAVRAGSGLYISTHAMARGTSGNAQPSDTRAAVTQLQQASERTQALADTAQKQNAKLTGEPAPQELPVAKSQQTLIDSQRATDSRGGGADADDGVTQSIQGGAGTVAAPSQPDLMIHGVAGIAAVTPAHAVYAAGIHASWVAGQDVNLSSQRHTALIVKKGTSLFTYGKASNPDKPNTETGMQFHAAAGSFSMQAQQNTLSLTADKAIEVASTTDAITMGSPTHVRLVSGGSGIDITTGGITLTTPGEVSFKASMKELAGGASASTSLTLPKASNMAGCATFTQYPAMGAQASVILE